MQILQNNCYLTCHIIPVDDFNIVFHPPNESLLSLTVECSARSYFIDTEHTQNLMRLRNMQIYTFSYTLKLHIHPQCE